MKQAGVKDRINVNSCSTQQLVHNTELITLVNTILFAWIFSTDFGNLRALNPNLVLVFAHCVTFLIYKNLIF